MALKIRYVCFVSTINKSLCCCLPGEYSRLRLNDKESVLYKNLKIFFKYISKFEPLHLPSHPKLVSSAKFGIVEYLLADMPNGIACFYAIRCVLNCDPSYGLKIVDAILSDRLPSHKLYYNDMILLIKGTFMVYISIQVFTSHD